ncbi:MAG: twin-arginine translocase TatA/TatE family subunit [Tenacibaculum sp.]
MIFLFIGGPESLISILIAGMCCGADKLPEIARGLGKGIRQIKDAADDIKNEITQSAQNQDLDTDIKQDIKNEVNKVKDNIDKLSDSIKRKPRNNS